MALRVYPGKPSRRGTKQSSRSEGQILECHIGLFLPRRDVAILTLPHPFSVLSVVNPESPPRAVDRSTR